jgi:hypothetical protein
MIQLHKAYDDLCTEAITRDEWEAIIEECLVRSRIEKGV